MTGNRAPKHDLTIGELFPDDDVVAQWVFSVTVLVEDLAVLVPPQQKAQEQKDLRAQIFFYRQMLTRLFEARRLVTAVEKYPDLKRFAGPLLTGPYKLDLRDYYLRPADGSPSVIEDLYGQIRHRSVHYMKVGEAELANVLREFARYPARITAEMRDERQTFEFQWVQAISAMEVVGDVTDDEFLVNMQRSAQVAANVALAWMMLGPIALIGYTHERAIDFERLGARPPSRPDSG